MGTSKKTYEECFNEFFSHCITGQEGFLTNNLSNEDPLFSQGNIESTRDFLIAIYNKKIKNDIENVEATYGIEKIFNGEIFNDFNKYNDQKEAIIKILLHYDWLKNLCSEQQHQQTTIENYYKQDIKHFFNVDIEWAAGTTFSSIPLDSMYVITLLHLSLINEDIKSFDNFKKSVEEWCNKHKSNRLKWGNTDKTVSCHSIINVLLFLCNDKLYLPIPAQGKKELICDKLNSIIGSTINDYDTKLREIREKLREIFENLKYSKNPFWDHRIRPFWDNSTEDLDKDQLSDKTLLEYKKAMILYGPPGTSKSYQARKMAEGMIAEALRKEGDIANAINRLPATIDSHIHILQMHPNYTYDDFIIGKSIKWNRIVVKPGKMLQIIKGINAIKADDSIPHFVILDEINRVDISRVFGELFTAMEASYRDKGVELSVDINDIPEVEKRELENNNLIKDGKLYLKVPENMFFIGTMNMIDFSLEQVDFALRRRFLWRLSTYDQKRLDEIISEKVKKEIARMQEKVENNNTENTMIGILRRCPDNFSKTCTDLNNEIERENSLGKSYLIGHAFFSEIVDIVKQVKDWDKAKNILWQVSILPTLEAYCGTMDANMQETFLGNCKKAFFPEPKEEKKK